MTGIPVNISLDTWFNLSIKSCNFLNFGITIANNVPTMNKIASIATPTIQAIWLSLLVKTFINPPIPTIGAYTTTLNNSVISCCICCISFVLRVIKDAVENWFNSLLEYPITFLNTLSRSVFPNLAATLEENNIIITAEIILTRAIPSISNPVINI